MSQQNSRRRTSGNKWLPITVLVVAIVGAGLGTYALLNDGRMPWSSQAQAKADEDRAGKKAYPRATKTIPAFTAVSLEHFADEKGQPSVILLEPDKAKAAGLLEANQVLGRVTKGDKRPGYGFTENDFLAKGSPASRTAAIPAGMVGVQITAGQIPTLRGLKANDRFVLVAAADAYSGPMAPKGTAVPSDVSRQAHSEKSFGAVTRRIVEGGVVIQAMTDAKSNAKDASFVAVPSAQYDELLSALNNQIEITALAESTNPTVAVVPLPEPEPPAQVESVTIQNGDQKQTIVLPSGAKAPSGGGR